MIGVRIANTANVQSTGAHYTIQKWSRKIFAVTVKGRSESMSRIPTLIIPMCLGFIINRAFRNADTTTLAVGFLALVVDIVYVATR